MGGPVKRYLVRRVLEADPADGQGFAGVIELVDLSGGLKNYTVGSSVADLTALAAVPRGDTRPDTQRRYVESVNAQYAYDEQASSGDVQPDDSDGTGTGFGNGWWQKHSAVAVAHGPSHKGGGSDAVAVATQSLAGLLSAADKTTLDGLSVRVASVVDQKSGSANGGDFENGAWRKRDLNTLSEVGASFISVSNDQLTLNSGLYLVHISAPALLVGIHQCRFRNVDDSLTFLLGTAEYTLYDTTTRSHAVGIVNLGGTRVFEVQHRCQTTQLTDGFGRATGFDEDVLYTIASFLRLGASQ